MTNARRGRRRTRWTPARVPGSQGHRQSGRALVGIYHSTRETPPIRPASMSKRPTGRTFSEYRAVHVIVSLMDRLNPAVKGYTIDKGEVAEVALQVV